jgi:valyl-tRNA synthetase
MHHSVTPWENMMISGFVTLGGEKMSKSKGNVISPQEITDKFGADALRYWAASSKLGEDTDFQEKEVVTGKKFVTKILNATIFVFMNMKNYKPKNCELEETDRLFIAKLNKIIADATTEFENYEYAKVKNDVMNFFWKVFCDNYLELVKNRVYNGNPAEKESASFTLYTSLLAVLKMMAPITPFITEELYQEFFKHNEKEKSIHITSWPEKVKISEKKDDAEILELMLQLISDVRMAKSKKQVSMKAEIILTLEKEKKVKLKTYINDLKAVLSIKELKEGKFNVEFI